MHSWPYLSHTMRATITKESSLRAYLDLFRLPNLFTAAADIFAGFFFSGGLPAEWPVLVRLSFASMCLYAAGVALNDYCDRDVDAVERPSRPLPSGRVKPGRALQLILVLFIAGLSLAFSLSVQTGAIAALLVVCVVAYDAVLKHTPVAPLLMGGCRALNLAMGMYFVADFTSLTTLRPIAIVCLYITAVTFFARTEARRSDRARLVLGVLGQIVALSGLWWVWRYTPNARHHEFVYLAGALALSILYNGIRAIQDPKPHASARATSPHSAMSRVQLAVKRSILGLVVLDACIAWSVAGPEAAAITLALLVPTVLLARFLPVT